MQLTKLQTDIQERADKTLSFGCVIFEHDLQRHFLYTSLGRVLEPSGIHLRVERYDIVGHPMNRGRLCYLRNSHKLDAKSSGALIKVEVRFIRNKETLQQTVLERPIELQSLVLSFLKTLNNEQP